MKVERNINYCFFTALVLSSKFWNYTLNALFSVTIFFFKSHTNFNWYVRRYGATLLLFINTFLNLSSPKFTLNILHVAPLMPQGEGIVHVLKAFVFEYVHEQQPVVTERRKTEFNISKKKLKLLSSTGNIKLKGKVRTIKSH